MMRFALVLLCALLVALALVGMRRGWLNRAARQAWLPAFVGPPAEVGAEHLRLAGLYVGSSFASGWQDRIVQRSLGARAAATAALYDAGVLIEREGADAIFIPSAALQHARLAAGLAGKVTGEGGLLVLRWHLGDAVVDSGLRADDKADYPAWVRMINRKVATS